MRSHAIGLGRRGHSLQGSRKAEEIRVLPWLWPRLMATSREKWFNAMIPSDMVSSLERDGYWLQRDVFPAAECNRLLAEWQAASVYDKAGVMRSSSGAIYGARNVLDLWPDVLRILSEPKLIEPIQAVLGASFGLVRVLFFDKPPGESWALPWHKDMAIAVKDNRLSSEHFDHPTTKYGVPHVEAPIWLLQQMLTARLHLDDVTDENGPLRVLPGSHRDKSAAGSAVETRIHCRRGDALLMRPLLSHSSGHSLDGTTRHRRVFHLEFSGVLNLPDGYRWHTYISTESSSR
jgi:Phytanoyl-CoA dioxygenase (PhyH)